MRDAFSIVMNLASSFTCVPLGVVLVVDKRRSERQIVVSDAGVVLAGGRRGNTYRFLSRYGVSGSRVGDGVRYRRFRASGRSRCPRRQCRRAVATAEHGALQL